MIRTDIAPDQVTVEFFQMDGEPVRLADLGSEFMEHNELGPSDGAAPLRVEVHKKVSKAGNAFYDYAQNGVPLPDGLSTIIKVEGTLVPLGRTRPSRKGYPTREGRAQLTVGGIAYELSVYVTQGRTPYYLKVLAHRAPNRALNIKKAQRAPRGGKIVVGGAANPLSSS